MNKDKVIEKINSLIGMEYYQDNDRFIRKSKVIDIIQSEPQETCEYCQGEKSLSERELAPYSDVYTGFGVDISGRKLLIESCTAVGTPSRDYTFSDKEIEIKFCPMCGKSLNEKAGE